LVVCLAAINVLLLSTISGCQTPYATNGSGYKYVKFHDPLVAKQVSEDETAGSAIFSNNQQCLKDKECDKK
jgi:hypothetical protein